MDPFFVLGETVVQEATGRRPVVGAGFDSNFIIDAASELAKRGVSEYQQREASQKSKAEVAAQLSKAVAADANWAKAEATLTIANASRDPNKIAPAQALQSAAAAAAMSVGAGLPTDAVAQRTQKAQDAANAASQDALNNPKDALKQAVMVGWQKVIAGIQQASLAPLPAGFGKHGGGNWLTKQFGPLPVWGWGLTAVGVVGVGYLVVRALRK